MKKNWIYKLGFLVIMLTLITTSLVSGTYAKYITTVTATDTVKVAKWDVDFQDGGDAYTDTATFDLFDTAWSDDGVDGQLLAPGTSGTFSVIYNTAGTEVDREVKLIMEATDLLTDLTFLKIYVDDAYGTDITNTVKTGTNPITELTKIYEADDTTGDVTVTFYWEWPFENPPGGTDNDALDTADGIDAVTAVGPYEITITFTATQLDAHTVPEP